MPQRLHDPRPRAARTRCALAGVVAAALALTGCGSTVQQADVVLGQAGAVPADGLGAAPVPGAAAGAPAGDALPLTAPQAAVPGAAPGAVVAQPGAVGAPATQPDGSGGGAPAGVAPQGPAQGAPAAAPGAVVTTPVKIGFTNTSVGNAESAGLDLGQTATPEQVFKTLASALNAQGGLAGRKIVPVVADTDTASGNWDNDYAAACETFTRDDRVEVVLGYTFVQLDSFQNCLQKAGIPHLSGGYSIGDDKTLQDFPGLVGTTSVTADRRFRLQLEGAVREGYLTKANKLGLIVDACPTSQRAVERTVEPLLRKAGLTEAARVEFNCPGGSGDVGAAAAQVSGAVLRFRQAGVDRVFVEGIPLVLFSQQAESQGYRPGYLVTSTSPSSGLEANMPRPQLANVRGYGWMPHMDVSPSKRPAPTAPQQRCLALLKSGGFVPREYNDFQNAYTSCDGLFAYEAALKRTGGRSDGASVLQALAAVGSVPSAGLYGGRSDYRRRNAPTVYRSYRYTADCGCFAHTSGDQPFA